MVCTRPGGARRPVGGRWHGNADRPSSHGLPLLFRLSFVMCRDGGMVQRLGLPKGTGPACSPSRHALGVLLAGMRNRGILGMRGGFLKPRQEPTVTSAPVRPPPQAAPMAVEARSCLARRRVRSAEQANAVPENRESASITRKTRISIPVNNCAGTRRGQPQPRVSQRDAAALQAPDEVCERTDRRGVPGVGVNTRRVLMAFSKLFGGAAEQRMLSQELEALLTLTGCRRACAGFSAAMKSNRRSRSATARTLIWTYSMP